MFFDMYKARIYALSTTHFCDASSKIKPIQEHLKLMAAQHKMLGVAHTVNSQGGLMAVMQGLQDAQERDILVIDAAGSDKAMVGELFATEARRKQLAGIIIFGACRDIDALRKMNFPFYALHSNPSAGNKTSLGQTQIPLIRDSITMNHGDVIYADESGIVVAPSQIFIEALPAAEDIAKNEQSVLERMKQGQSVLDLLNFREHLHNLENNKNSSLTFKI